MDKVSIIIPIFNRAKYISSCIDKVINQDYPNLEIILVDDGSKDNAGEICDDYAAKYSNIFVYHQKNKGVSAARNLGLSKVTGEWVCFVDSDDSVDSTYVSDLLRFGSKSDLTIMGCSFEDRTSWPMTSLVGAEAKDYIINNDYLQGGVWSKLFKTSILKKWYIVFPDGLQIGEDTVFLLRYLQVTYSVTFVPCINNYHLGRVEDSLVLSSYDIEVESRLFKSIRTDLLKWLIKYEDYDVALRVAWQNRLRYYLERCIYSAIKNKRLLGSPAIQCEKWLNSDVWEEYNKFYCPTFFMARVYKFIIGKKLFGLYECLERIKQYKRTGSFILFQNT